MRRGSALLIVLGMISFLVVSAVAFSAFMRTDRLPSSYLLRSSSSRNLVKAGLAEALDEIDRAIGNNPHPGVGTDSGKDPNDPTRLLPNRNQWRNRIFLGTNMLISADQTVSTLTLEGLAYVPAPLVNEARYYSRRSPAGAWHTLGFDSGRFAFTAIDVSDYFDVNRTQAAPEGGGRTSADDARVTLAYLFEDEDHGGWRIKPDAWDNFMADFYDDGTGSRVPLVSWADLNLAIWDKKPAGVVSPWCRFIENGTEFVQDSAAERHALSNAVFVTDSWYPRSPTQGTEQPLDLASGANQPFSGLTVRDKSSYRNRGVDELAKNNNAFMRRFSDNVSLPELVQLCDYLDADSVPTTLAMPTTERVPMLTGVSLVGSSLGYDVAEETVPLTKFDENQNPVAKYTVTYYTVKLRGQLNPMVSAVYPFKHSRGTEDSESFEVQVAASVTLVPKDSEKVLRRKNAVSPVNFTWLNARQNPEPSAFGDSGPYKSVLFMRSDRKPLTLNRNPTKDEDCVVGPVAPQLGGFSFDLAAKIAPSAAISAAGLTEPRTEPVCTLRVVQRLNPDTGEKVGNPEITRGFLPANAELSGYFKTSPDEIAVGDVFVPAVQLGVRIVNSADETVDLMPACADDDRKPSSLVKASNLKCAFERPFLRFWDRDDALAFSFTDAGIKDLKGKMMTFAPQAYVADDPRFNHAPEDLVAVSELTEEVQKYWLSHNTSAGSTGNVPKDGDIYMATSDAGYLQSKYELAFLLNITGLFGDSMWGVLDGGGYNGNARTSTGDLPGASAMWHSYSPYPTGAGTAGRDDFDRLEMTSGDGGARVCPYTPDTAIMMGALANTPRDWWAASTNADGTVKGQMLTSVDEALKYTYSEHSQGVASKVECEDIRYLAEDLIADFSGSSTVDGWKTVFDNLSWHSRTLFKDIEANNSGVVFHQTDRKYLYGFWRECFAARQQLFLVFVRAEPMMMGSGLGGNLPPMLGARAVALVWRDPTATRNNAPHRMRILFYRQFD